MQNELLIKIEYRDAIASDLESIESLLQSNRSDTSNLDIYRFIVASIGKEIIGCVRTKDLSIDCIELASLVVNPEYRKLGIGVNLVKKIIIKDKRRPIYLLCVKILESFYKKAGFENIDKEDLPDVLKNEYKRISSRMPDIVDNILTMKLR